MDPDQAIEEAVNLQAADVDDFDDALMRLEARVGSDAVKIAFLEARLVRYGRVIADQAQRLEKFADEDPPEDIDEDEDDETEGDDRGADAED